MCWQEFYFNYATVKINLNNNLQLINKLRPSPGLCNITFLELLYLLWIVRHKFDLLTSDDCFLLSIQWGWMWRLTEHHYSMNIFNSWSCVTFEENLIDWIDSIYSRTISWFGSADNDHIANRNYVQLMNVT